MSERLQVQSIEIRVSKRGEVDLVYELESGAKTVPIRVYEGFRLGDTLHIKHKEGYKGPDAFSIRSKLR